MIEDNPADVTLLRVALNTVGLQHQLRQIRNGRGAIGCEELLSCLRQSESLKTVPVIVISGSGDPGMSDRLRACGADDYISKPANLEGWLKLGEYLKRAVQTGVRPEACQAAF